MFSETASSECPSRAVMCNGESVEGLSVEIASELMQKERKREREMMKGLLIRTMQYNYSISIIFIYLLASVLYTFYS
jgi:hypothetical protein